MSLYSQVISKINLEFAEKNTQFIAFEKNNDTTESPKIEDIVLNLTSNLNKEDQKRILSDFFDSGPLTPFLEDSCVTEIIVNSPNEIWIEKAGTLQKSSDSFLSSTNYYNFIDRICREANVHLSLERPFVNGHWRGFRFHLADASITQTHTSLSIRKHPQNPWNLDTLLSTQWTLPQNVELIRQLVKNKANLLVVGPTSSGKTSVLNSLLQEIPSSERILLIEDCSELFLPNSVSLKLLTREIPLSNDIGVDQSQLLKQALRMRPDRIVVGEIRGGEAKDLLMALATGHTGSWGTLHASSAHQALLRLEMLIQMGAPQWNLTAIRNLIFLSLNYLIVVDKDENKKRYLKGVFKLSSLEENGFLIEKVSI